MPIFLGYMPVGMAFGILAYQYGFSLIAALVCSATALAGAGQFIALATLISGASAMTVLVACGVVNLRYVLFSATLSPYLQKIPTRIMAWLGFTLTDESFAINVADLRAGTGTPFSMAGVGLIAWCGWVLGTAIGWLSGGLIGDPNRFGIDYAMAAMFSALFVALAEDRRHVLCGIGAGALVCALWFVQTWGISIDSHWFITIASLTGATIAMIVFSDTAPAFEKVAHDDEMILIDEAATTGSRDE